MNAPPLQRLIRIAQGDSGQSHVVADFLLPGGMPMNTAAST
jgi:hypothetical protein